MTTEMADFRGDLRWVHNREGHAGRVYWPGGRSGLTIDPGVDLGHAPPNLIEKAYGPVLRPNELAAIKTMLGVKGVVAKMALADSDVLQGIQISAETAARVFAVVVIPYWRLLVSRFPALSGNGVPGCVHTAMLSLAYNRGAFNRDLSPLGVPITRGDWHALADIIGRMQQDHQLPGIRKRRRAEAQLIRDGLPRIPTR